MQLAWKIDFPLSSSCTSLVMTNFLKPLLSRSALFNIAHIAA